MTTLTKRDKIGGNNPPSLTEILKERFADKVKAAKAWLKKAEKANLDPKTPEECAALEVLFAEARDLANDMDRKREEEKKPHFEVCKEIDSFFNGTFRDALGTDSKKPGAAQRLLQAAAKRRLAISDAEKAAAAKAAADLKVQADKLEEQRAAQEAKGQNKQADVTAAKVDALDAQAEKLSAAAASSEPVRAASGGGRSATVSGKLVCVNVKRDDLDLNVLRAYFDHDALVKAVNNALKMQAFEELKGAVIERQAVGRVR